MNASWQINYDREEGLEAWLICEAGLVLAKGARGKEKKWIPTEIFPPYLGSRQDLRSIFDFS